MPILSNPKYERFAQGLAAGKSADEAYEAAGYSSHRGNASRLSANESVLRRVEELQARIAEGLVISQQWLIEKAEEARALAMSVSQPAGAVAAIKEMGILAGIRVEKRENTNRTMNDYSDDDLARIAFGSREGASEASRRSSVPDGLRTH